MNLPKRITYTFGLIALTLALTLLGAHSVDAKGKEPPMATRVTNLNQQCTDGGGTASNQVLEGGSKMVTHCDGGAADGLSCTITRDNTVCKTGDRVVSTSGNPGGNVIANPIVLQPSTAAPVAQPVVSPISAPAAP